jgi:hypothetical protein
LTSIIFKPLRVVVDLDTVDLQSGGVEEYLGGLLRLDDFRVLRYRDDGPPLEERRREGDLRVDYAKGWLMVTPVSEPTWDDVAYASWAEGDTISRAAVGGGDLLEVPLHFAMANEPGTTASRRSDEIRQALVLRLACDEVKIPLLVTNRRVLLDPIAGIPQLHKCTVLNPDEALRLVGTWLRTRGQYITHANSRALHRVDRGLFYAAAATDLLPRRWTWAFALARDASLRETYTLHDLGLTVLDRFASAIKAFDRALSARLLMNATDAQDEGIECVETVALHVMGAFDATARIVDALLRESRLPGREVGWQKSSWLDRVRKLYPRIGEVADQFKDSMSVARLLRNTIHARRMNTILLPDNDPDGEPQPFIALPREETDLLQAAFEGSGGLSKWGVRQVIPGRLEADPQVLMHEMLLQGADALNALMEALPIQQILAVDMDEQPPAYSTALSETELVNIRMQLGIRSRPG